MVMCSYLRIFLRERGHELILIASDITAHVRAITTFSTEKRVRNYSEFTRKRIGKRLDLSKDTIDFITSYEERHRS